MFAFEPIGFCFTTESARPIVGKSSLRADLEFRDDAAPGPFGVVLNSHKSSGCVLHESAHNHVHRDAESAAAVSWRRYCQKLCQPLTSLEYEINRL